MFTVTPIGSCRIAGPLRHGRDACGIGVNQSRVYGYCHAPAEAVQMARFLRGEIEIPADIWPLVSRSHDRDVLGGQAHSASDLYVIELASAKELSIDGVSVQLNYLRATYPEFFADTERAQQFWAEAEAGDGEAMTAFLAHAWSDTAEARAQSDMLTRVRMNFVTEQSLNRDIETLSDLLGNVLFVSHVNAQRPCGAPIASRARFIDMVADTVTAAGHDFCNPTDLMAEFGQAAALEDDSTSLAHFTDGFSAALMNDWATRAIAPRTGTAKADGAAACRAFEALPGADAGADVVTAASQGQFETALDAALSLPGRLEDLPAYLLSEIAQWADAADASDAAFEFALAALRKDAGLVRPADLLVRLARAEEIDLLGSLDADKAEHLLATRSPEDQLHLLRLNGQSTAPEESAVDPKSPEARKARQDLVRQMRAHGKAGDLEALESLAEAVSNLPEPLAEYDLWRARVQFKRGAFDRALDHGLAAAPHIPEKINLWVLLMRAALKLENLVQAREFAAHVIALACERTKKLKAEAERVLSATVVGA